MSWDVELKDGGDVVKVPFHVGGGTTMIDSEHLDWLRSEYPNLTQEEYISVVRKGYSDGWLNITYNYSLLYHKYLDEEDGLRWLDGRIARDTIEKLSSAVKYLGTERSENYWEPTTGNAGYALSVLLSWAEIHPDAVWEVR